MKFWLEKSAKIRRRQPKGTRPPPRYARKGTRVGWGVTQKKEHSHKWNVFKGRQVKKPKIDEGEPQVGSMEICGKNHRTPQLTQEEFALDTTG